MDAEEEEVAVRSMLVFGTSLVTADDASTLVSNEDACNTGAGVAGTSVLHGAKVVGTLVLDCVKVGTLSLDGVNV